MDCNALQDDLNEIRLQANKGITLANENEQYSRRNNLRIRGLAPAEDNDNLGAVLKFLTGNLGVTNVNPIDIVAVHPLPPMKAKGHQPDGTARPAVPVMLLKLRNRQIRDNIIMKRKALKGSRYSIDEDLTALNIQLMTRLRNHEQHNSNVVMEWQGVRHSGQ